MISRLGVVHVCNILVDHLSDEIGNNKILSLVEDLKKVKANQSYKKTIVAIEEELRWRFGKDV